MISPVGALRMEGIMGHPLSHLIEAEIARAEAKGDLKGLPGEGKPIKDLDPSPDALLFHVMKEAGGEPEVVTLRRKVAQARERLASAPPAEHTSAMKALADLETRLALALEAYHRGR